MATEYRTFNRARLRKLIEAGKVELVEAYHFDDMYGEDRTQKVMPVALKPADWRDRREGVCYLSEWDFTSESGRAYVRSDAPTIVHLRVHSNSSYDLRIKD